MSKEAFTLQYQDVASKAAEQLGVSPTALLAQWGLETGWGKSIIPGTNNLGNIKDFSGKGVEATDSMLKTRAKYRAYKDTSAFADDYVSLIKRRYPGAMGQTTAQGFATALVSGKWRYTEDPDYVQKLTTTAGETYTPAAAVKDRRAQYDEVISKVVQGSIIRATPQASRDAQLAQETADIFSREAERPTDLESFGAAMAGNTDHRILDGFWGDKYPKEEGFMPNRQNLPESADSSLIEDYMLSKSTAEAASILQREENRQLQLQTVNDRGGLSGFALGLVAEGASITNWVVPFASIKALHRIGKGSLALAQSGNRFGSVSSSIAENLVSGTAVEVIAQSADGRLNGQDLLVSLVADSLLGLGTGLAGIRGVAKAEAVLDRAATAALAHEIGLANRATEQLGAGAAPGELRQVMDSLHREDMNQVVTGALADVPTERKLIREVQADTTTFPVDAKPQFGEVGSLSWREAEFKTGGVHEASISDRTGGTIKSLDELHALPSGVHYIGDAMPVAARPAVDTAMKLARKYLGPDFRVTLANAEIPHKLPDGNIVMANGDVVQVSEKAAMIRINPNLSAAQQVRSVVHEIGHTVFNTNITRLAPEQRASLEQAFTRFITEADAELNGNVGRAHRFSLTNTDQALTRTVTPKLKTAYERSFDEFSAEQFVKYMEDDVQGANTLGLAKGTIAIVKAAIDKALEFLGWAKRKHLGVTNEYKEFFETVANQIDQTKAKVNAAGVSDGPLSQASVPSNPAGVVNEIMTDPDAAKFGLTIVPVGTAAERKQAQAMLALHKQAAAWEIKNPMDAQWESRVKNLADNNVFNVASTGLVMLKSKSPLVRMLASELVEDASGAAGKRQATAAISKYMQERFMMGNTINDVQGAYAFWKKDKPGGLRDDLVGGNNWAAFHKEVASEIEARRLAKGPVTQDPNIKAAADSLEASYQRIANAQRAAGTIGNEGLPTTSVGYMPHRMSPKAVINMTNEQGRVLHDALVDQFVTIEGWDHSFSDKLASEYMLRVRNRAGGDYGSAVGGSGQGAASQVEEALRGMNLPEDTIAEHMKRFEKGGANFTKGRIELDLNKVYTTSTGDFRLLDIFETNQIELLRSQAGRASGEVALTKFGVQGKPGLKLLRDALAYGEDGKRAGVHEKEAFDQMAAEFMNEPFGTNTGKFMERAMAANTLVRLGGIGFNQLAESINGIFHVGAARTMASVGAIPRMRQEIKDLVAGKHVDNPFLTSIEHAGGAEFGTDAYKTVLPFDSPDHAYPTYGQDTLTVTDRLLRGGGYLQAKLSGWKMIHSAQQRGFAEQIVKKLARYVNEGTSDVALRQFGITPDVQAALKKDLHNVTTFDAQGNPLNFDATKITDPAIREQVIQAVWRGTQQIIQGTFIGERGKWAHDGWMKLLTQFRGFGITSMEKQWGRQRNDRGGAAAFGIMVGSMTIAAPIYMARVYASSIGRPDQQAYIDERLTPDGVARATLNYIALSGMAGDFLDLGTTLLPEELGVKPTGGRVGVESDFVGNYVLPASSLVNDIWKYTQSPLDAGDAAKILPMSRIPYIVPFVNAVKD